MDPWERDWDWDRGRHTNPPPLPLSFDRVNEGRFARSNSFLFKLPFEVLGQILQHVEPTSLPSLAPVNRDCRQLARSRQFARIPIHFRSKPSGSCVDLMKLLRAEDREREANHGATLSPSLGVCIRCICVLDDGRWLDHYQLGFDIIREWEALHFGTVSPILGTEGKDRRRLEAGRFFNRTYLPLLQSIVSSRRQIPHLNTLELHCAWPLEHFPQSFFNGLIQSSIQHLKLTGVCNDEHFAIGLPGTLWPLRTLQH